MPAARPCSCPAGPFCLSCRCSHTDSGLGPRPLPGLLLSSVAVTVLTHSRRLSRVGHRQDEQTRGGGAPRSTPWRPKGRGVIGAGGRLCHIQEGHLDSSCPRRDL